MFDVGFWELSLIGVVALVVVGPEKLPSLVSEAGKWAGRARGTVRDLKYDLQRQAEIEELADLGKGFQSAKEKVNPGGLKKNLRDLIDDAEAKAEAEVAEGLKDGIDLDEKIDDFGEAKASQSDSKSPTA